MPKFISFEGLCGVGKSTVSELVASKMGIGVTGTIPTEFDDLRRYINANGSVDTRYLFYLTAVVYKTEYIQRVLQSGKDVLVESYLYRTIAFHQGMGSRFAIEIPEDFLQPTHVIQLICEDRERKKRLAKRGDSQSYWDVLAEESSDEIKAVYNSFNLRTLDVTNRSPQEVCDTVLAMIKEED